MDGWMDGRGSVHALLSFCCVGVVGGLVGPLPSWGIFWSFLTQAECSDEPLLSFRYWRDTGGWNESDYSTSQILFFHFKL